ncbi:uncharacterized protein LOC142578073 [Dermacentor variabilis]|uniref:uncharacterized protein LOC142578073 n=1 Tax=Dermacentor variabilis TaxID=34621 RepID=UPI003F5C8C20
MLTEIIPSRALKANLYILNVYSSPIDRLKDFNKFLTSAASQTKDGPLIVDGDFNALNIVWGYAANRKAINLAECADWSWESLQEDFGSDHFTLEMNVRITPTPPKTYTLVDWDVFQK